MDIKLQPPAQIQLLQHPLLKHPPFFSPQNRIFQLPTNSSYYRRPRISFKAGNRIRRRLHAIKGELGNLEEDEVNKGQQMKRAYPFHEIEPKWQRFWEDNKTFRTPDDVDTSKPKFYVLDMFPYPSCTEAGMGTQMSTGTGMGNGNSLKYKGGFGCWDVPKYPNEDVKRQLLEVSVQHRLAMRLFSF